MAQTIEVQCAHCGRRFQRDKYKASRYSNSYCNDQCRGMHKRKRVIRVCAACGNEYETQPTHNKKYCSKACTTQGQIGQARPYMVGREGWAKGQTKENNPIFARRAAAATKPIPSRDALYQSYTLQNLTCSAIAQQFDVSKGTVGTWIDQYELIRMRELLTEELLRELISKGLTHESIGSMYSCSKYYVGVRTRQHGIRSPQSNRANRQPDAATLHHMYWNEYRNYEEIATAFGVTPTAVYRWFARFDIPARTSNTYGIAGVAKDGHKVKSLMELQVDDWLFEHGIEHEYEPRIPGTNLWADFLVDDCFIEVWGMMDIDSYRQRHDEKMKFYQQGKLRLLSIYPEHFPALEPLFTLTSTLQLRLPIFGGQTHRALGQ